MIAYTKFSSLKAESIFSNTKSDVELPTNITTAILRGLKDRFEELTQAQMLLEAIFDSCEEGILVVQTNGKVVCMNAKMISLWGWSISSVDGYKADQLFCLIASKLINAEYFLRLIRRFSEESLHEATYSLALLDGRIFECSIRNYASKHQNIGFIIKINESTDYQPKNIHPATKTQANASDAFLNLDCSPVQLLLDTEQQRTQKSLSVTDTAVITINDHGFISALNPNAITLTGWKEQEALGKSFDQVVRLISHTTGTFLTNPLDDLLNSLLPRAFALEIRLVSREGEIHLVKYSGTPLLATTGKLLGWSLFLSPLNEISLKSVITEPEPDSTLNLPHHAWLADCFAKAISKAQRQQLLLGVCKIDLDDFKPINDRYGHELGDKLLSAVNNRMLSVITSDDTLARLGGDEFALLIGSCHAVSGLKAFLERILVSLSAPYVIEGKLINVSASIGMTLYPQDNVDADALMRHADQALYHAKLSGRNRIHVFDIEHDQLTQNSLQTCERLRQALVSEELCLHYQPKVNMRTSRVFGMEALLRWHHPEHGLIQPAEFLPQIEQHDLIIDIGEWVIEQALKQLSIWAETDCVWVVSVNIAARHFQHPEFLERLTALLAKYPEIPPQFLEIEILESVAAGDIDQLRNLINQCQNLGVTFSLDDFGTGYSSLSYLKQLPADTLKIDQSFVRGMLEEPDDLALIDAVINLANVFNRKVIAEGVETPEHGVLLMRLGCDCAQGFGIAHPMLADEVTEWVKCFKPDPSWSLWANVPWELNDFPLLVAQYDHQKWLEQLLKLVNEKQPVAFNQELTTFTLCRFGQWYAGPGKSKYHALLEFSVIGALHKTIHQLGDDILTLCTNSEFDPALKRCKELVSLNDAMMSQLKELQMKVADTRSPPRKSNISQLFI